jgi:hypothetical protein
MRRRFWEAVENYVGQILLTFMAILAVILAILTFSPPHGM